MVFIGVNVVVSALLGLVGVSEVFRFLGAPLPQVAKAARYKFGTIFCAPRTKFLTAPPVSGEVLPGILAQQFNIPACLLSMAILRLGMFQNHESLVTF